MLPWCLALCTPAFAQDEPPDPLFATVPFEQWVAEGPRTQIPWKVRASPEGLSVHQRLVARAEAQVDGKELEKRRGAGRLLVLVQFKDQKGNAYRDDATLELKDVQRGARKTILKFAWEAFVLPGEYEVTLALYDTTTGEHNLAQRRLRIDPLKEEPLRDAWRDLPSVEILKATEGPERFFRPEMKGRLHLPLETRRPIQLEVLVNLTPTEFSPGSRKAHEDNLSVLLPILKIFSQIDLRNGSVNVATLDAARRGAGFEQSNVRELDWPGLKAALAAADPGVVDVRDLRNQKENAAFLRKELARRMEARDKTPASAAGDPLRVFLLIGTPVAFQSDSHANPLAFPEECNCVVYYLRYEVWHVGFAGRHGVLSLAGIDDVAGMLKPLKAQVLAVHTAEGLRKAVATLLDEISRM